MKKLYALDFDKTLISYDSFRRFLKLLLAKYPVRIGVFLIARKLRLMDAAAFKERITQIVENNEEMKHFAQSFAQLLEREATLPQQVNEDPEGEVLIISASPACYMQYLRQIGGRPVIIAASDYVNGEYCNLYGRTKQAYIAERFSTSEYIYSFAMSDSESDLCWLQMFEHYDMKK